MGIPAMPPRLMGHQPRKTLVDALPKDVAVARAIQEVASWWGQDPIDLAKDLGLTIEIEEPRPAPPASRSSMRATRDGKYLPGSRMEMT